MKIWVTVRKALPIIAEDEEAMNWLRDYALDLVPETQEKFVAKLLQVCQTIDPRFECKQPWSEFFQAALDRHNDSIHSQSLPPIPAPITQAIAAIRVAVKDARFAHSCIMQDIPFTDAKNHSHRGVAVQSVPLQADANVEARPSVREAGVQAVVEVTSSSVLATPSADVTANVEAEGLTDKHIPDVREASVQVAVEANDSVHGKEDADTSLGEKQARGTSPINFAPVFSILTGRRRTSTDIETDAQIAAALEQLMASSDNAEFVNCECLVPLVCPSRNAYNLGAGVMPDLVLGFDFDCGWAFSE